ncbi:MAG TPA: glycine oxidase ThiO [Candidatus Angelobacter sp.]|nr:glycine oxidase ThiO [Candidatus Angelobacter sp.]
MVNSWDVIIAGAGIIGVSLALELRGRGANVLVLDKGEPGGESSSAAAGMLAAGGFETPPALRPLAVVSARIFPEYVSGLERLSGVQTDFRRNGTIAFLDSAATPPAEYKRLAISDLNRLEPSLQSRGQQAFFIEEDTVDPRLLMRAALAAAQKSGIEIRKDVNVVTIRGSDGQNVEVESSAATLSARTVVNCRGAWAGAPVKPRKGQMLYVQPPQTNLLQHVVHAPEVYVVPRSSGKILIGATVEDVGFDKTVTGSTIHQLLAAAARYLPGLESASIIESWAGLRPGTPDDLPILGRTDIPGVFAATGHFRNGILLAPITARIMADVIAGKKPPVDISAFAITRFAPAGA